MMNYTKKILFVVVACFAVGLLTSCSTDRNPNELFAPEGVGVLVVDAVLIVNQPWVEVNIRLSRTVAPNDPRFVAPVRNAAVVVRGDGETYVFQESPAVPGVYRLANTTNGDPNPVVTPRTRFELAVETLGGERLGAVTNTPEQLQVTAWQLLAADGVTVRRTLSNYDNSSDPAAEPENQIRYQDGLLDARFISGDALAIQVGLFALTPDSGLTIDPDFLDEEDIEDIVDEAISSPPLSADNQFVRLPWAAVYYYGTLDIVIFSIDRNWYDLARSSPDLAGDGGAFGGNIGDGFDTPIFRVDGGIGLFGSASRVVNSITIVR